MALSPREQLQGGDGLQTTVGKQHLETKQQRTLGNVVMLVHLSFSLKP